MDGMLDIPGNRPRPGRWRLPALAGLVVLFLLSQIWLPRDVPGEPAARPAAHIGATLP